jgi:hypothetical protein
MEYVRNYFPSSNKDDIELSDLNSGDLTPEPGLSNSQMEVGDGPNTSTHPTQPAVPNYSHSFPTSDAASNIHALSTDSMQIETSGESSQLLSLAKVETQSDANQKHSWHQDQANSNKVRIIAQTRMSTAVSVCYL